MASRQQMGPPFAKDKHGAYGWEAIEDTLHISWINPIFPLGQGKEVCFYRSVSRFLVLVFDILDGAIPGKLTFVS